MNSVVVTAIVIFSFDICSALPISAGDASEGLVLLHVIHRHGARTRDSSTYPTDPYANETFFPFGLGQLTNVGKQIEFDVGRQLRQRYNTFLGDLYFPELLEARTTNINRTKMSLELSLAGLYPPKGPLIWNPFLNWQPIPYNYVEYASDYILGSASTFCSKYSTLLSEYTAGEGAKIYEDDLDLYAYLSEYTGWNVTTPKYPFSLYFDLKTEEEWGLELPSWTKPVWEEAIKQAAVKQYNLQNGTPELKRLSIGFFFKKVLEDSINKVNGTLYPSERILFLYSAHESNIAAVLSFLDLFPNVIPNYGSHVIIEVREVNGVYGIQVLFQNYEGSPEPALLTIPGCTTFCPLDQFVELIKDLLPEDESECDE